MSKLIAVSDRVYLELKSRKNGRSFSEVITGLCSKPKKTPLDVLANWAPEKDFVEGLEKAYSGRKKLKIKRACL